MDKFPELSHLFMTVFLFNFAGSMVAPAITDVTMSALCPGEDECSLAIYLSGIQSAIIGLGTLVMMPLIGKLSDIHGRKFMLTVSISLSIIPQVILAVGRTKNFFYVFYGLRTLTGMACDGSVFCLALAFVADNIPGTRRASAIAVLSGISSATFVSGNLCTRFLSASSTFQVSASAAAAALVYMRVFLSDSLRDNGVSSEENPNSTLLEKNPPKNKPLLITLPSLGDTISLFRSSKTFTQAAVVAFFIGFGDDGLFTALMYYLKARFHYNKDQFADILIINGVAGTISQILVMPLLVPAIGEEKLLCIGLLFSCAHMLLYSIAWASWVPYAAATFTVLTIFPGPCIRSIVSKQVGPNDQGKAQGCITGISSFANVVAPLVFSPLTAIFLSETAPFHFPGFSIMCAGFISMIAFIQGIMIKPAVPVLIGETDGSYIAEP